MKRILKAAFCLIFLSAFFSSCENEFDTNILVSVRDNKGLPIEGANVSFHSEIIGSSDKEGFFKKAVKVKKNQQVRVEVTKKSTDFYYAPYFESVKIGSSIPESLQISAVLYLAPKSEDLEAKKDLKEEIFDSDENINPSDVQSESLVEAKISQAPLEKEKKQITVSSNFEEPASTLPKELKKDLDESNKKPSVIAQQPFKIIDKSEKSLKYLTVQVKSKGVPVDFAQVSFLEEKESQTEEVSCLSNDRGRCVLKFTEADGFKTVKVFKEGYNLWQRKVKVSDKAVINAFLEKGRSIDIYTVTQNYFNKKPLSNVEILIDGRRVGYTNSEGFFSYPLRSSEEKLVEVALLTKNYLPKEFKTDVVAGDKIGVLRHFSHKEPKPVRIAVLEPKISAYKSQLQNEPAIINQVVLEALKHHFFDQKNFADYPQESFYKTLKEQNITLKQILSKGAIYPILEQKVDAFILPTITKSEDEKFSLELRIATLRGKTLTAISSKDFDSFSDKIIYENAKQIAQKLPAEFPFESAVSFVSGDKVTINMGFYHNRAFSKSDMIQIFGFEVSQDGKKNEMSLIAEGKIETINQQNSEVIITYKKPRSFISEGDLAILVRNKKLPSLAKIVKSEIQKNKNFDQINSKLMYIAIKNKQNSEPISQCGIYINQKWYGMSDGKGLIAIEKEDWTQTAFDVKVSRYGYKPYAAKFNFKAGIQTAYLQQENGFLKIESEPSMQQVYVDDKLIGKTPLSSSISVPTGFVKLKIDGPKGYKPFVQILELDDGSIELIGNQKIVLEKDYISLADEKIAASRVEEAISILEKVEISHSDYLSAKYKQGEIYLNILTDAAKAVKSFHLVTSAPGVASFQDKRFIGAYINEALATFTLAETLTSESKDLAKAHFIEVIKTLDQVFPYLRFVQSSDQRTAEHSVFYYKALSYQKLYSITKEDQYLSEANKGWKDYLSMMQSENENDPMEDYRQHAEAYLKQTDALMQRQTKKL